MEGKEGGGGREREGQGKGKGKEKEKSFCKLKATNNSTVKVNIPT